MFRKKTSVIARRSLRFFARLFVQRKCSNFGANGDACVARAAAVVVVNDAAATRAATASSSATATDWRRVARFDSKRRDRFRAARRRRSATARARIRRVRLIAFVFKVPKRVVMLSR